MRKKLQDDALKRKITKETFAAFSEHIKHIPIETINKTILSMNKRMQLIVNGKGNRTKYKVIYYIDTVDIMISLPVSYTIFCEEYHLVIFCLNRIDVTQNS